MGNCQAVDAAALVIQHPSGKQERMYRCTRASEVMKMNPGHYVSLIIPITFEEKNVGYTRVKLLRPSDTLLLGRAYRLLTTQEVMKVIRAKKHARTKRNQSESDDNKHITTCENESAPAKNNQARHNQRSGSTNVGAGRPRSWRPSLQSISESGS